MYTEEPNNTIEWGNVLKKIIIAVVIILIIFLIIWLFNRSNQNSNKVNVNYDGNTTIKSNNNNDSTNNNGGLVNPSAYSESFITNYTYFHDTARDFVEKYNLPIEDNSVKYTLQELINKKILLPTSYGNTTCDTEASYVIVTNSNGKYTMTTTLICGNEIAKTEEELKCSELCNGNCEKEEEVTSKEDNYKVEYEFRQAYNAQETIYTCPAGYTKTGSGANTKCTKGNVVTIAPIKNESLSCPSGYTKTGTGNNTKCVKSGTEIIKATATTTYTCSNGATPNSNHMCPVTTPGTTTYSCSNGATPTADHKCPVTTPGTTTYSCSDGSTPSNGLCYRYTTGTYYESYTTYHNKTYKGCSYVGASVETCTTCVGKTRTVHTYKCTSTSTSTYPATAHTAPSTTTYVAAIATTTPASTTYVNATVSTTPASTTYVNATVSTTPAKTAYVAAKANTTYSCTKGTLSGTNCIVNNTDNVNPIKNISYVCEQGYTKNGVATTATCTMNNQVTVNPTVSVQTITKYRTKWSPETSLAGWTRTGKTRNVKAS